MNTVQPENVAVIGMAGRFPQAATLDEFWSNLREGREAVTFFNEQDDQWLPLEHPPGRNDPRYVRARAALDRPEWFDAAFFRVKPQEAAIMDPQQRVFLECAWEALEHAGCNPDNFDGAIGVFTGAGFNSYLYHNLLTNRNLIADYGLFPVLTLNEKDYLATRVAYKLNLRGPAINVQTACSTSLVAVALACQQLLDYHCDLALAGGVSISFPENRGHLHVEGGIMSKDGHCRAFDASASGTVVGSGAGVVVLKRLSDAVAAGDRICAVIKGYAINNDGGVKMGFTAPSIDGQAECIAAAQSMASFEPGPISYVEAHGTGTPLGDPIEMAALAKAFRFRSDTGTPCAIGSLKTNVGHLDVAAGVAGLIKTVLALQHGEIPPSLHYERPNPEIDFSDQRFFINQRLRPWLPGATPRRAGVSSFGIGGTNAHVVVEEAPVSTPAAASRPHQLLLVSARTPTALEAASANLAEHLERNPDLDLADVAYTLQTGRKAFEHRRAVVAGTATEAVTALRSGTGRHLVNGQAEGEPPQVVFMFPGQGAQTVNMARELYATESTFRREIDASCALVDRRLGLNLREVIFPVDPKLGPGVADGPQEARARRAAKLLDETRITQPAMFIIEHALARLWMQWGIKPAAMIGHSLGEYVAACIAGVFTLPDALALVTERARLMQAQPTGAMLAIRLPEDRVAEYLNDELSVAAVNAPRLTVVSGPCETLDRLEKKLAGHGIAARKLATSHAFHSAMMDPVLPAFAATLRRLQMHPPTLPWVSNVTGTWITPEQATSPDYWVQQLRGTVRFAEGVTAITRAGHRVLLEVGPGQTLAGLARQQPGATGLSISSTLGKSDGQPEDLAAMLHALGAMWVAGVCPTWKDGFYAQEQRRIVPLPTYPFERKRYWIEPGKDWGAAVPLTNSASATESAPMNAGQPRVATANPSDPVSAEGAASLPVLKQIFQELSGLELEQVSPETTFSQLGFDSLFLGQACVVVARRFGVALAFRNLRDELGTFRKLAEYVDRHTVLARPVVSVAAIESDPATAAPPTHLPLTEAQREIWMVSQLGAAAAAAYHECAKMELEGPLNTEALTRALNRLMVRHEALRTTFSAAGDEQVIATSGTADFEHLDFTAAAVNDAEGQAAACLEKAMQRPFDLEHGPLLRPVIVRIEPQRHVLALIVHHIICDGWSLGILVRELAALYAAEAAGTIPTLPAAPRFSEYARRRIEAPDEPALAAAAAYWREHFADAVPVLDLPTDRARPASRSYAGNMLEHTLPPELTAAVRQFCADRESTAFTVLLAVFNVLLHRLTGQADLVVGVPTAGQALENEPELVGHFANLLPVRSQITQQQSFTDYFAQVQRTVSTALEHGTYPFPKLLQQLKLPRDSSRVPLTPVLFNMVHHRGKIAFADAMATLQIQPKQFVNFDLNFNLAQSGDSYVLGCYYSTELFDAATVARWLRHFETLLRNILAEPTVCVSNVPLLTESERRMMVVEWNSTVLEYPREACIHHLFEQQVRRTPAAIALVAGGERISYDELDQRADRLAVKLRASGVGPEVLVGILLERSAQLVVAILAILKAGGAYVPLDPSHPPHRLDLIATDTRLSVAITQRNLQPLLPQKIARVLLADDVAAASPDVTPGANRVAAENLAYVIYTSGSTGQPKGVCVPHRGVVALVAWARQTYRADELAGVLFATSATFDVSVCECLVPLCLGGKVILAENLLQRPALEPRDPVTLISGVPSAMSELVRAGEIPSSVRTINLAGEPCPQALVDALYALPQIERVYDLYGPTETTVYSTGGLRQRNGQPTIGRPLPNEKAFILDAGRQPVPIGVRGELYIGGEKLARGYLHRPELTEHSFVAIPDLPAERVYRTGDAARFLPDGTIEYLGRIDRQVKIRGYRIELGEIEAVLSRYPGVAEAAAMAYRTSDGIMHLVAYVVGDAGHSLVPADLRKHAGEWLPAPMVPAQIMLLERLPRTANGKLDRRALPEPEFGGTAPAFAPPRTEAERYLAELWCEVLGLSEVGVEDNFFALGGHSLRAMQVISRVRTALDLEITLQEFLANPTIAALANTLEAAFARTPDEQPPDQVQARGGENHPDASDPALSARMSASVRS